MSPHLQSLLPLWSWLPAFRAVAETEHLPTAAALLGVGPSALSRSIGLLERELGKPLFRRDGRALALNRDGERLLDALRYAMRATDDGLQAVRGDGPGARRDLTVTSAGAGTTLWVVPALRQLQHRHPHLQPQLLTRPGERLTADLLRGAVDVAFLERRLAHRGLETRRVARLPRAVYCGRRHPWYGRRDVPLAELATQEFVGPPAEDPHDGDGWPPGSERRVTWTIDLLRVGVEVCTTEPLLAVLPDALAARRGDALHRLGDQGIVDGELFAVHRRVLRGHRPPGVELADLVGSLASLDAAISSDQSDCSCPVSSNSNQ